MLSQTSLSSSNSTEINLSELLAQRHAAYICLPEELCAASRPSSPTSEERVANLKAQFVAAVNTSGGDTTHPKWGYVSRLAHLGCTSRKYVGIAPGIRIGDGKSVSVGKNFMWELPETEELWEEYEQRWKDAVEEEERRKRTKTTVRTTRTSKYFKKIVEVPAEEMEEEPGASLRPAASTSSKAEVIRDKVERWQAQVPVAAPPDVPMSQDTVDSLPSPNVHKGKGKERAAQGDKVQASLGFRVVKRTSVTSAKGGGSAPTKPPAARDPSPNDGTKKPQDTVASKQPNGRPEAAPFPAPVAKVSDRAHAPGRPKISPVMRVPTPPSDGSPSNQLQDLESPHASERPVGRSEAAVVPTHIAEVSESSFLPPSFPSQLQTSTPPLKDRRHKPPPIAPCSPPPSSPYSVQSLDASRPTRNAPQQQASSSLPSFSPLRKPLKRARTPNATPDDDRMDISELQPPLARSPVTKKARTKPRRDLEQEPASSGPVPVPPSTPPPTSSPHAGPATPVSKGKGLGNAIGLPVPTTPDAHPLPTLTELLASSRRSRPRPRPPSRKNTPHSRASSVHEHFVERDSELPVVAEIEERSARDRTPEPSPTKTYFSSPASGSSVSPGSVMHRPRSPVSPLFTQNPSAFAPRFVSTQQPGVDNEDPFMATQASLVRGSSGFFAMGYSSQFDLEGHVEQVSELLERDVDFNGWLRDLDAEDGLDQDHDMATASQSQDAGVVGAGF
ncbi:hypothetical protein C8Q80DRAFT_1276100 [Daedaleopsis nitida]|nr:hypothetical protein C8Q80DRAFT_1276100 [Daedaleopsis nitida]